MARRRNNTSISRTRRAASASSNGTLVGRSTSYYGRVSPSSYSNVRDLFRTVSLYPVEDARRWNPTAPRPYRSLKTIYGSPVRSMVGQPRKARTNVRSSPFSLLPHVVAFEGPSKVVTCIRRQRRREVLFAKNQAGRSGLKHPTRNWASSISCKG